MDWSLAVSDLKALVKDMGVPVTISRLGTTILKDYGAFLDEKTLNDPSSGMSSISKVTSAQGTVYIVGSFKNAPLPGDELTSKGRDYVIASVMAYQPGPTVLGYKIELE